MATERKGQQGVAASQEFLETMELRGNQHVLKGNNSWRRVLCSQTWSPIIEISISALQLEHLMLGKKLDGRVAKSIFDAYEGSSQAQAHTTSESVNMQLCRRPIFFRSNVTTMRTPGSLSVLCNRFDQQAFTRLISCREIRKARGDSDIL